MSEKDTDCLGDVDMNKSAMAFDNLTILKEFGNIANLVRDEDFVKTVPKAKLSRIKWVLMFNCLKQDIYDDMVQEISSMWEYEGMVHKLQLLEKQKEKFSESPDPKWRPQLGDVKSQVRAHDVANLQKQKKLLESLAKEYESRASNLKKTLTMKRGYIRAVQLDLQNYQKKNEDFVAKLDEKFERSSQLMDMMLPSRPGLEAKWTDTHLELGDKQLNTD